MNDALTQPEGPDEAGIGAGGEGPAGPPIGIRADQPPPPADRSTLVATIGNVDKRFGAVRALDRLNVDVPKAKITVLLGPNGAGKTTAIRMITGAMSPDGGTVSVFGHDPTGPAGGYIRRKCGVVSAKPSLYDRLSGLDNLRYAAELYDLGRGAAVDRRIGQAAEQFGIDDALDQRVGGYSTGMKTRLALARSILHDPELLLLDEPTSGLDPESAQAVLAMVREMTTDGRSVLMCTHLLLEAEGPADEVGIIQDGTSLMGGDPTELASRYWPRPEGTITARPAAALDQLHRMPEVLDVVPDGDRARVVLADEAAIAEVIHGLSRAGVDLVAVEPHRPSLEDLYFAVRREHEVDTADRGRDERTDPTGLTAPHGRPAEPGRGGRAGRAGRRELTNS
ncbi:MAG: ATP-binding cassette domain-containing protein [Acidimicrobiales bacterium]